MNPALRTSRARTAKILPLVFAVGVCGCGHSARTTSGGSTAPAAGPSRGARAQALRVYLRAWETSWRRVGSELGRSGGDDVAFSDMPDASWDAARRYYELAAIAYRHDARRLAKLDPPAAIRAAHDAYAAAVRRQEARFQALADAFGGTDPQAMERALEALEFSQLKFDRDGARWERGVIAACRAAGVRVPEIVRREYVSNGQRTAKR